MLFKTLRDDKNSDEGIEHLELDANTKKVAVEYNDKTGNQSIVKVANRDRDQVQPLELLSHPVLTSNIF